MQAPAPLRPGDKAMILSTARLIEPAELAPAIAALESWGLQVVLAPHVYAVDRQYAGTDAERLADLQAAFDDPEIRLILCSRGGYGTLRIIDQLDLHGIRKHPKWVVGFSDLTVLHVALAKAGLVSIHGPMAVSWNGKTGDPDALNYLRRMLFGEEFYYQTPGEQPGLLRTGSARGRLIGGNLSILSQLIGTRTDFDTAGAILFLEDVDEYFYHIDRMMVHLARSGKLASLAGLVVGGFTDMKDNKTPYGKIAEEIVAEWVAPYDFPVTYGFPVGHWPRNYPLLHGAEARLNVAHNLTELHFLPAK
jgi:muramoyltetrapeptide carboxypeptidase